LPYFDELAREEVYSGYAKDLDALVSKKYPGLPESARQKLQRDLFKEYLKENKKAIKRDVLNKEIRLKEYYQDERGYAFLAETDSFRWMRWIQNYSRTGRLGTSIRDKQDYDDLMFFPGGAKIEPIKGHYYLSFYFYKVLNLFNNKLTLAEGLGLFPVFFSVLAVVMIFVICALLGVSVKGSFIASLAAGMAPVVLGRTSFGWFDTDIYNLIMPLAVASCIAFSLNRDGSKQYPGLLISGLLVGLYSSLWASWWVVFYICLFGLLVYNIEAVIYSSKDTPFRRAMDSLVSCALFVASSYLFVLLFSGPAALKKSFVEPLSCFMIREGIMLNRFWPNLAPSIAELKRTGIYSLLYKEGGILAVYGGFAGLLGSFVLKLHKGGLPGRRFILYLLFVWLLSALFLTHFGIRFTLFLALPLGISLGLLWDIAAGFFLRLKKGLRAGVSVCVFSAMCLVPLYNASTFAQLPVMNRTWQVVLSRIKQDTPKNAVINAWWDYGDFIMTLADRATVHDASYQHAPVTYWVSRALLSDNENEAFGILRMIDSGGNNAFDEISSALGGDKIAALKLVNNLVLLDSKSGRELLLRHIKDRPAVVEKIIQSTYGCKNPAYLLIEDRMLSFFSTIFRVGRWDFEKSQLWLKFRNSQEAEFTDYAQKISGYSQEDARVAFVNFRLMDELDALNWITDTSVPLYSDISKLDSAQNNKMLLFDNGLAIEQDGSRPYFRDYITERWFIPGKVILVDKEGMRELVNSGGEQDYAALLQKEDDTFKSAIISSAFSRTLFFKLFFNKGRGLKHFRLTLHESSPDKTEIYLYKIE
jgi:dolichyl-diphosphooligosaccharide--protein glycosyltransferase